MKLEILKKIRSCKELRGKTIKDIVESVEFVENLAAYWVAQKADREATKKSYEAMRKAGGAKGYRVPAHPIDDLCALTANEMAAEYYAVLMKMCNRPAAERKYIYQLGQQAYNLTIAQIVIREFPELEDTLIPKSKNS